MKNIRESLGKVFAIIIIILIISSVVPIKGNESKNVKSITITPQTKMINIPENHQIKSVSIQSHLSQFKPKEKPKMQFYTTNYSSIGEITERVYTEPYTYETLFKGKEKYLRINVPKIYYKNNKEYITKEISLNIEYEPSQYSQFTPSYEKEDTYEYIIITNETFYPVFKDFYKDWKIGNDSKINNILILNVSDITPNSNYWVNGSYGDANTSNTWLLGQHISSSYELFNDTQAKIRNFIRYAYDTYSTRYILLGGNKNAVPTRMIASYAVGNCDECNQWYNDTNHASDMYYECLHYSMNNNTNDRWMENNCCGTVWDEIDWGYDVYVGRTLVRNNKELFYWINKTKNYVEGRQQGNYLRNFIVAAKNSGNQITDQSWLDLGAEFSASLCDEFPDNITFINNKNITQAQWNNIDEYVNGEIESFDGIHIILHQGHGGSLYTPYAPGNTDNLYTPNFVYTEGCNSGDFGTDTASRMAKWMRNPDSTFAVIANSAYGWFGASTYYVERMMSEMFNDTTGNHTMQFSKAHQDAKEIFGHDTDCVWAMIVKETNFGGDPAMEYIWYDSGWEHSDEAIEFISIENNANKTTIITSNPTFNWTRTVNTSEYALVIANSTNFEDNIVNITNINIYNYPAYFTQNDTRVSFTLPPSFSLPSYDTYYCEVKAFIISEGGVPT